MKYTLYLSNAIDAKVNSKVLGKFDTIEQMWALSYQQDIGQRHMYCRYLMGSEFTSIDFGSWGQFLLVEPPLDISLLEGR